MNNLYSVRDVIVANKKRMQRIHSAQSIAEKRDLATRFVVAECQAQHVRLSKDDIIRCAVYVLA